MCVNLTYFERTTSLFDTINWHESEFYSFSLFFIMGEKSDFIFFTVNKFFNCKKENFIAGLIGGKTPAYYIHQISS